VQPSLALFATLEGLLRQPQLGSLDVLMSTLLVAVRALLQPVAGSLCCSDRQTVAGNIASTSGPPISSTVTAKDNDSSSSTIADTGSLHACNNQRGSSAPSANSGGEAGNSTAGSGDSVDAKSSTNSKVSGTFNRNDASIGSSSSSNSSSSSTTTTTAAVGLPGVLEAVCSAAITAGKVVLLMTPPKGPQEAKPAYQTYYMCREGVVLGAQLSNAVLQLALQRLQVNSKTALQLM
jgi:hypothetical protein